MSIEKVIEVLVSRIVGKFADSIMDIATASLNRTDVSEKLRTHFVEIAQWANQIQFMGMSEPRYTSINTVELPFSAGARKYQSTRAISVPLVSEADLLEGTESHLLLGDPGGGKTTTIKRLALRLLKEPASEVDKCEYPIVIRLRELPSIDFFLYLSSLIGLPIEAQTIVDKNDQKHTEFLLGEKRISDILPEFLSQSGACLLLDGLDEMSPGDRGRLEATIVDIRRRGPNTKIICTCRSGDYRHHLEGFNITSIDRLSTDAQSEIAASWLGDSTEFMRALRSVPYFDTGGRPLLLTQLIVLFARDGGLPTRPSDIYDRLVSLLLRDWDDERKIARKSNYADFWHR